MPYSFNSDLDSYVVAVATLVEENTYDDTNYLAEGCTYREAVRVVMGDRTAESRVLVRRYTEDFPFTCRVFTTDCPRTYFIFKNGDV